MARSQSPYSPQRRKREPAIDRKAHKALLREIAKLIDQPADSLAVKLVALARLKMNAVEAQLIAGDPTVTVADITTLQEVFDKYVPKKMIKVEIEIVKPSDTAPASSGAVSDLTECRRCGWIPPDTDRWPRCPQCGWKNGDDVYAPWQLHHKASPRARQPRTT